MLNLCISPIALVVSVLETVICDRFSIHFGTNGDQIETNKMRNMISIRGRLFLSVI